MVPSGLISFRAHCGLTRHLQAGPQGRCLSFGVWGRSCYPPEVTMVSSRVQAYDEATQGKLRGDDVDLVDKRRWKAALQNARYHQVLRRYHQRFVHSRQLQLHNMVL
jgi:hypothetical protein